MNNNLFPANFERMAGVVSSLETDHHIRAACEQIDNFPFAFITPLGSHYYKSAQTCCLSRT